MLIAMTGLVGVALTGTFTGGLYGFAHQGKKYYEESKRA